MRRLDENTDGHGEAFEKRPLSEGYTRKGKAKRQDPPKSHVTI